MKTKVLFWYAFKNHIAYQLKDFFPLFFPKAIYTEKEITSHLTVLEFTLSYHHFSIFEDLYRIQRDYMYTKDLNQNDLRSYESVVI